MNECWRIHISRSEVNQNKEISSFIGGYPRLPPDIPLPKCNLCGSGLAFLFQLSFPEKHAWFGRGLAIFRCISCVDEEHLIPEMLQGPLAGTNIPENFLDLYQKNFRFIVFNTNELIIRSEHTAKVVYKPIELIRSKNLKINETKIGGFPNWLLEDESPGLYADLYKPFFLLQLNEGWKFDILEDAPREMKIDYLTGKPGPSPNPYYQLFLGNEIYLFGIDEPSNPLVYAITQID